MSDRICRYCEKAFLPSRYRPDQRICSLRECQRRRRADYHRNKLVTDPIYGEQCRDSQAKWRAKNPDYMKRYRAQHRPRARNAAKCRLINELRRLLKQVENNVAQDLRPYTARVWFLFPKNRANEKNNPARAEILVLPGILHTLPTGIDAKNIILKTQ